MWGADRNMPDNNIAERALRSLGCWKAKLVFAGSDKSGERIASILSITETAKLHGQNPEAYLTDAMTRIKDDPADRLEKLLP